MATAPLTPGPRPFLVELALRSLAESFEAGYISGEELEQGREWILSLHAMEVLEQGAGEC